MSKTESTSPPGGQLERGAMGTADIVFFVLAGVAPMGVVVALLTLSIALGNGAGVPGTYAIAGVVLALFAAGYVRMSRRIANVGGFYTYARQGLGRRAGGATAYTALLAYNAATIGIFGALAYFAGQTSASFGVHISWQVWALIAYAIVAVLAYDLDATVGAAVAGRLGNTGQACNAAKRFIVIDGLYEAFVERFTAALLSTTGGLAPLSSVRAAETLDRQVQRAVEQGASLSVAGERSGAYFPPAVLTAVTADHDVYSQELFGPVAMVFRASSEDEAIALANDTPFGLGSYVFTTDPEQARHVADRLDAGMVFINGVHLDSPELPFGGVKRSGFGRELGDFGMDEFVNKKLIRTLEAAEENPS